MALRIGFLALLAALYAAGAQLTAHHAPSWVVAALMGVVFVGLVAAMYLRVLPALLALPVLALALAGIAGMGWKTILTDVVEGGGTRLGGAIYATLLGAVLAQLVEKTGIAQTAIKKTAELGGDRPLLLATLLTLVTAVLFITLGGLGAVIMVATIVLPILLSLGLRPLYVGCLFLLGLSLGGAFNLANWKLYQDTLGLKQGEIMHFALPFAVLMLVVVAVFIVVEHKRIGQARFKAAVVETDAPAFVPWYALLTPIVPLLPVLFFNLLPVFYKQPAQITLHPQAVSPVPVNLMLTGPDGTTTALAPGMTLTSGPGTWTMQVVPLAPDDTRTASVPFRALPQDAETPIYIAPSLPVPLTFDVKPWTTTEIKIGMVNGALAVEPSTNKVDPFEFPIPAALLLGILYGAVATWRRGQSTVQLVTKAAFDGVAAVGPAVVLMLGIGMVLKATISPQVSGIITPLLARVMPGGTESHLGQMVHYVALFAVIAPLALFRGPLNMYGMGAGIIGALSGLMPAGAIMGAFMSVGMIQGVCDPTNTHNVWIANYTNTDVQDILKRTLPYMWALAVQGLLLSAVLYYK
jgi:hypothetical protein